MIDIDSCDQIILRNVPDIFFDDQKFNSILRQRVAEDAPEPILDLIFFKSFHKVIIYLNHEGIPSMNTPLKLSYEFQNYEIEGFHIGYRWIVYDAHSKRQNVTTNLQLPAPKNLFLLSPPVSPPDDWEPVEENSPIHADLAISIDGLELDSRLAGTTLQPGCSMTLLDEFSSHPGIVIENLGFDHPTNGTNTLPKPNISQVRGFNPSV